MRVTAWSNGGSTYGIRIGVPNRRAFFDEAWSTIDIEIEGRPHTFELTGGFKRGCPEVRDRKSPVIREWLKRHHTLKWPKGRPPSFELVPLERNRFRLIP